MKPTLLILAAGMGSRYGGIKQIDSVGPSGEIILEYSIYDAIRAGFGKVVFVIRKDIEEAFKAKEFEEKFGDKIKISYVYQELSAETDGFDISERSKPWGTGHAILMGASEIHEPFAAINADDYYGFDAFAKIAGFLTEKAASNHYCMVGYILENTLSENGTVSRGVCEVNDKGHLSSVTERTSIQRLENGEVAYLNGDGNFHQLAENTIVSMNYWGFYPNVFEELRSQFQAFLAKNANNPKAEFYIPSAVQQIMDEKKADVTVLTSTDQWYGVTYQEDKAMVQTAFKNLLNEGVYPQKLW
jgi:UTP-glucose-1-phosphate uridylyltransferase